MRVNINTKESGKPALGTGHIALRQPCTLRGRLGLRRRVTVWGGADATPDRAIGPFADANLVSILWRSGS